MTSQDRKRYYHEAFQLSMNAIPGRHAQIPRIMSESTLMDFSSPLDSENCNKENGMPFDNIRHANPLTSGAPQCSFLRPLGSTTTSLQNVTVQPRHTQPLQDLTPVLTEYSRASAQDLLPMNCQGLHTAFPSGSDAITNSSVLGSVTAKAGHVIYEDNVNNINPSLPAGRLSPGELKMQQLSLFDTKKRPLPATPKRPMVPAPRATVFLELSADWAKLFPELLVSDVIIVFDKTKQVAKVSKYPLSAGSRYFKDLLGGPFVVQPISYQRKREVLTRTLQPGKTITIRLRNDFPYAVRAMVEFIKTEYYHPHKNMNIDHPTMTMLDLHIHAYLIGIKYGVLKLANLAIKRYIGFGNKCLSMKPESDCTEDTPINNEQVMETQRDITAMVRIFLESLAFLWNNTRDRKDVMRTATLKLLKHHYTTLMKIPFFGDLKRELKDFESDLIESLAEDGLQAMSYAARVGEKKGVRFG